MRNRSIHNHKGFSLVELVVVIALMAVMMSAASFAISYIFATDAKACAAKLEAAIQAARTEAMSKDGDSIYLTLSAEDDGYYVKLSTDSNSKKIGSTRISMTCFTDKDDDSTAAELTSVDFKFVKASGAFKTPMDAEKIVISGSTSYELILYRLTGKVEVKRQ